MVNQAEIHRMAWSQNVGERKKSIEEVCSNIANLNDKKQAWDDLINLTHDTDIDAGIFATVSLKFVFPHVPNKEEAWSDLIRLANDINPNVRYNLTDNFRSAFPYVFNKEQAWMELIELVKNNTYKDIRSFIAYTLGSIFPYVPNKQCAWNDLFNICFEEDPEVIGGAIDSIYSAFPYISDKESAWHDIFQFVQDKDYYGRFDAVFLLFSAFPLISNKDKAWVNLMKLTNDEDVDLRNITIEKLGSVFRHVQNKKDAWKDLHQLSMEKEWEIRWSASMAIKTAFPHIPDKTQGWADLIRLTKYNELDDVRDVRESTVEALGSVYPYVPNRNIIWNDIYKLTFDGERYIRVYANYSLGRASIFNATVVEKNEDFQRELEKALNFFEKSSKESPYFNPARFCLPFYRSFHAIVFKKENAESEVEKYLSEAKSVVANSKSKEKLLEAVENLGNELKEAQKVQDVNDMESALNAPRRYLERTCELLDTTEEKAPIASRLIRKGLPIIDERIKEIWEIQDKAKALCKKTRGTSLEEIGLDTVKQANELSTSNELKMDKSLGIIIENLIKFNEYTSADKRDGILDELKKAKYLDFPLMVETIAKKSGEIYNNFAIPPIITVPTNIVNKQKQDIVRIAAIQLDFKLTNSFPPALEKKNECKQKIISALDTSKSSAAHIACLPELCMCEEWVQDIKDRYPDMIIIGGSYYKNDFNVCPLIMNIEVPSQLKKSPSRPEDPDITGRGMKSGDKLYRYETHFGTFSVLVCIDFLNYAKFCDQTDIIFCPSYNEAKGIERFHEYANSHVTNTPSYIIISNSALFGGTSIFGQLHRDYYRGLVENGCKKSEDDSYKLCDLEKGFEGIIIADFDLIHKSSQVPSPSDSSKVIKSIKNIRKINIS